MQELQQGVSRYIVLLANISVPASAWPAQGPVTVSTWRDLALSGWPHAARRTYLDLQRQPRRINLLSRLSIREPRCPPASPASHLTSRRADGHEC